MKKIITKCFLGIVPILIWLCYASSCSYYYMDDEYPYWKEQKDYINNSSEYNEIVVLGDSATKASFRPNLVDNYSSVNLALGGGTSVEMYYSLKNYLENHESPKLVIFSSSPVHYITMECNIERTVYFHYLNLEEIIEVRNVAKELNDSYWNFDGIDQTIIEYYCYNPTLYLPAVYNANLTGRERSNLEQYDFVKCEKGWMHFGTADGFYGQHYLTTYESFQVNSLIDYYLKEIINLCDKNNISFVIEQLPIENSSINLVQDKVVEQFENYFEKIEEEYPSIIVNTMYFGYDESYFGDSTHLNEKGTKNYTDYIIKKYDFLLD